MEDCKRSSHSVLSCKYHLVWTTKYRYQVLAVVGLRCRELLRDIARYQCTEAAGTILNKTRITLHNWFAAIWYVTNQKNGVSALGFLRVFAFRFNRRTSKSRCLLFYRLLEQAVNTEPVIYENIKSGNHKI